MLILFSLSLKMLIAQKAFVETAASRALYIGAENPIRVHVPGYKSSQLNVSVSAGEITKKSKSGNYSWKICEPNNSLSAIIKIYNSNSLIDSIVFRLKYLPDPNILIPDDGIHSHAGLIFFRGVRADIEDFFIEGVPCKVLEYDLTVFTKKDSMTRKVVNSGAYLSDDSKKLLNICSSGDIYIISNILVKVGCLEYPIRIRKEYSRILE